MTLTDLPYKTRIAKRLHTMFPKWSAEMLEAVIPEDLRLMDTLWVLLKKKDYFGLKFEVTRLIKQHNETIISSSLPHRPEGRNDT